MKNINRRDWLKISGLTGAASIVGQPINLTANTSFIKGTTENPIRLSSNENPYGPSPKVRAAMTNAYDIVCR